MNRPLRLIALFAGAMVIAGAARAQVGVNATGAAPNPRAMMDINHNSKGLLIPRMTEAQRMAIPISAAIDGMIVYQTPATSINSPEGYWYFDWKVPKWFPIQTNGNYWSITGNAGTNVATDYVGTSDAVDLGFRTNSVDRMRITALGRTLIPITSPATETLNITGALMIDDSSTNPPQKGNIIYSPYYKAHMGNVDGTANGWYELENVFIKRTAQNYDSLPAVAGCAIPATPPTVVASLPPGTNTTLFSTIETPYSTFWEDGRHQYLYKAADLQALGICPYNAITCPTCVITGVGFLVVNAGLYVHRPEIKMKLTATNSMTDFDYAGLQLCYDIPTAPYNFNPVVGWNTHTFNVSNFQWDGTSNVIVEFCFNNYEWAGSSSVDAHTTPGFNGLYGSYCDACGGGGFPCVPTIPPNPGCGVGPCGPGCPGICSGYSTVPGCNHFQGMSVVTCDGTFQWIGAQGAAQRRPDIRFLTQTGGGPPTCLNTITADYLLSSVPVLIGSPAWAATSPSPYSNKGPGTLVAQVAVWGGNTMLSDHVFDRYFDGSVRAEDGHASNYRYTPLKNMVNYVEREHRLPTMDGRDQWADFGAPSIDHLTNQLWVTVEEQALYIKELNERLDLLQKYLIEKRLRELGR